MNLRTTQRLLVVVTVLQAATLYCLFTGQQLPVAAAQVPDAGAQRIQQIEELRGINARLDAIVTLLKSGELQVRPKAADEKKATR
jgi:hypothetical protein